MIVDAEGGHEELILIVPAGLANVADLKTTKVERTSDEPCVEFWIGDQLDDLVRCGGIDRVRHDTVHARLRRRAARNTRFGKHCEGYVADIRESHRGVIRAEGEGSWIVRRE